MYVNNMQTRDVQVVSLSTTVQLFAKQKIGNFIEKLAPKTKKHPQQIMLLINFFPTVIHFLIFSKKIVNEIDGTDFHSMRCVNRRWRHLVSSIWKSKENPNTLEAKLKKQWLE